MKRKINAIWKGDGADGTGVLTAQSGAFNDMPYSFKTRFTILLASGRKIRRKIFSFMVIFKN